MTDDAHRLSSNADLGILGVHRMKYYNDDTGCGITECGLAIFPHEVVNTDKPVWGCNVCPPDKTQESIVSKDGKPMDCVHEWAHIEDHHVICRKCKHTADLCWTCESEKTKTRDGELVCLKCNPQ